MKTGRPGVYNRYAEYYGQGGGALGKKIKESAGGSIKKIILDIWFRVPARRYILDISNMYLSVGITGSGQSDGDQGHPRYQVAEVEEHHTSSKKKKEISI